MGINVWTFTGNLPRDAEQRFLTNGTSIVSFSVGVDSGFGDKKKTTWVRASIFGDRGGKLLDYLKKGQLVGVTGEVTMNEYTNKEGVKQSSLEVRVSDVSLLGKRAEGAGAPAQKQSVGETDDLGADVPF